jgi:hypothetical protein
MRTNENELEDIFARAEDYFTKAKHMAKFHASSISRKIQK